MTSLADEIRDGVSGALDWLDTEMIREGWPIVAALVDRMRALEAEKEAAEADADRLAELLSAHALLHPTGDEVDEESGFVVITGWKRDSAVDAAFAAHAVRRGQS